MSEKWPPPFPIDPEEYDDPLHLLARLLCYEPGGIEWDDDEEDEGDE